MGATKYLSRLIAVSNVKNSTMAGTAVKVNKAIPISDSGIHKMAFVPDTPFKLFKKWHTEQQENDNPLSSNALCLATATKDGKVSSRSLILRRLDDDGFVIMTDKRSKKSKEMDQNPSAAMTFLWFKEMNGIIISRQVRAEGDIEELSEPNWLDIYEKEPLFCKIRAHVCHQGQRVEWDALKQDHDQLLEEYIKGQHQLEKPEHVVAYKLLPTMMEFYETNGPMIADRVMYLKSGDSWDRTRIAA